MVYIGGKLFNNKSLNINKFIGGGLLSKEFKAGCGRVSTTTGPIEKNDEQMQDNILKGEKKNMIMVGKPAPTFTAPAFQDGKFSEVNLEDYKGKWVLLCFYPGDFTFV